MWDDDDEEDDDLELPDDDDDETIPCPYCRKPVYEDAEQCPTCGKYLSREDTPWRRPVWLVGGVILCLLIVFWWTLG
ncbi:MAG: hypothetical protein JWN86_749 [Planctomycetota bacterium]|nr:hypothetical protein [Planctomycetota bacterium]